MVKVVCTGSMSRGASMLTKDCLRCGLLAYIYMLISVAISVKVPRHYAINPKKPRK
jgi:hypothetical protein